MWTIADDGIRCLTSLSHTQAHPHTLARSLALSLSPPISLSHTHTLSLSLALSLSPSLSVTSCPTDLARVYGSGA